MKFEKMSKHRARSQNHRMSTTNKNKKTIVLHNTGSFHVSAKVI